MKLLPLLACVALALAACGQSGPLHLPEDAPAKESYLLKKRAAKPAPTVPEAAPAETPSPTPAAVAEPPK
jgi:predicted small lipoprotein YifL